MTTSLTSDFTGNTPTRGVHAKHHDDLAKTVGGTYSANVYGATGDGVTDDSAAIQSAIDAAAAAGGGRVVFTPGTYRCNVVLKANVSLCGPRHGRPQFNQAAPVVLKQAAAGPVIDTPVSSTLAVGVQDIAIYGLGAGTAGNGIKLRDVTNGIFKRISVDNFADEGILELAGIANVFEDILVLNCVLNRSRAAAIGAIDLSGSDHFLSRVEATISGSREGTVQSVNLYCVAIALRAHNSFLESCVGEISDIGIWVDGTQNRFSLCRADLNYGHGWKITTNAFLNQFSACMALSNSQDTTNTYDNWQFLGILNQTVGCSSSTATAKAHRYGFFDDAQTLTQKNRHFNPIDNGAATAPFRNNTNSGSAFSFPSQAAPLTYGATVNTDVSLGADYFQIPATNGTAFTIAAPTKAVQGQQITYEIQNNSGGVLGAITWNAVFKLAGAFTNPANTKRRTITFRFDGAFWIEVSRAAADI